MGQWETFFWPLAKAIYSNDVMVHKIYCPANHYSPVCQEYSQEQLDIFSGRERRVGGPDILQGFLAFILVQEGFQDVTVLPRCKFKGRGGVKEHVNCSLGVKQIYITLQNIKRLTRLQNFERNYSTYENQGLVSLTSIPPPQKKSDRQLSLKRLFVWRFMVDCCNLGHDINW